ncbi:unnamed protein product [Chilo suppressalis]|uniref:Lipase n=1 Tax=Chilo suppressalis TaxID=168631 RepID=A0ABN8B4L7_CHISP|nr:unnamed protein product [Chilo suppressalis]
MILILLVLCWSVYDVSGKHFESASNYLAEDGRLNFTELVTKYGQRKTEEFDVITEDSYILKLFHIEGDKRRPILMAHGLIDSPNSFIARGNKSLALALAEKGYDCWFMSVRGKKYSRKHLHLNPDKDAAYWDFSFHEIGMYDLSATIDFVLKKTNQTQLTLIGFSQGNQIWFVLGSLRPEYNAKVKAVIALAPVAYMNNTSIPGKSLWPPFNVFLKKTGQEELFGENSIATFVARAVCSRVPAGAEFCLNTFIFPLSGIDLDQLELEFMTVFIGHCPSSTSRRVLDHMIQVTNEKTFQQYNHGPIVNFKKYGSFIPPKYPLEKITAKIELLVGRNDVSATADDVKFLNTLLRNSTYHEIDFNQWSHLDFVFGRQMDVYLFPLLLDLLKKYN